MNHEPFISLLATGTEPTQAYLQTINPNATPEQAETEGLHLANQYRTQVAELITEREFEERMLQIDPGHRMFIELVARGMSTTEAYSRTVGKDSTRESCSANGSRLVGRYRAEIADATKLQRARFNAEMRKQESETVASLLSENQVMERLCSIIKGEGGLNGDELCVPTYKDMLRAIEIHFKVSGKLAPKSQQKAIEGTIVRVIH